jgi:hypothetical protein
VNQVWDINDIKGKENSSGATESSDFGTVIGCGEGGGRIKDMVKWEVGILNL